MKFHKIHWKIFAGELFCSAFVLFLYSVQMRENADQKNSVFGHFSRNDRKIQEHRNILPINVRMEIQCKGIHFIQLTSLYRAASHRAANLSDPEKCHLMMFL